VLAPDLLAEEAEGLFEAGGLFARLFEVRRERGLEIGRARRLDHLGQRLDDLLLGVIGVTQFVEESVV
jgi:hypothetical protein